MESDRCDTCGTERGGVQVDGVARACEQQPSLERRGAPKRRQQAHMTELWPPCLCSARSVLAAAFAARHVAMGAPCACLLAC